MSHDAHPQRRWAIAALVGRSKVPLASDVALAAARVSLAWIFIYYGAGKLFGSFHGPGLHQTSLFFSTTAHLHPGGLFAVLGGAIELGGGLALAVGFASRLAALALFFDMVMAMITVTWAHGLHSTAPQTGYELNLALASLALVVVCMGAGRWSLDSLLARHLSIGGVNEVKFQ